MNDYQLSEYAKSCALDIVAEFKRQYPGESVSDNRDDLSDQVHEYADGSEHVIYYHKAHDICQNCNTDDGEAFLEDVGNPTLAHMTRLQRLSHMVNCEHILNRVTCYCCNGLV